MKTKQTLALLACICLLFACGGGGGGDSSSTISIPPPVTTNAGGIWKGTYNTDGMILELHGMVTETGEGRFYDFWGNNYIVSNVSGNDGDITMDLTVFARNDDSRTFTVTTGTINGIIVERVSFKGDFSVATGESGTISLIYDALYDRDSSLAELEGMWRYRFDDDDMMIINADGRFFLQNMFGCAFNGQISIIDPDYNAYAMTMTIALCGHLDGAYSGLGRQLEDFASADVFLLHMNSNTMIVIMPLERFYGSM